MSSIRKLAIPSPVIPKIKKPSISKRNQFGTKISSISKKRTGIKVNVTTKPITKKKPTSKRKTGTCYIQVRCRHILERRVTKTQCEQMRGKSWRKTGGICEKLVS